MTPDQSRTQKVDNKGVSYLEGNRHARRWFLAFNKKSGKSKKEKSRKGDLLPKDLRVKGKSKFLLARLDKEKKKNINELYL